ncbi:MAG: deoxyguanosinetriphosphate triphosphohydrolase, partial [Clostridia bacterium]|nr:deoxyguanosinetriphosphate triphosphohydrolase [Clostridia bacterium]
MSCLRETFEEAEKRTLAPEAMRASETRGRLSYHEKCTVRTEFQRDRDKIIHSNSFRRLKQKT